MSASLVLIPPMASTCRRPSAATAARYRAGVTDCVFCDIIAGTVPAQIVLDDEVAVAFLDARPVFKGHVLVAPRQHYETLPDLPAGLVGPLFTRVQRLSAAVLAAFGAQGSFVALNNTSARASRTCMCTWCPAAAATACAASSGRGSSTPTPTRQPGTPSGSAMPCPPPNRREGLAQREDNEADGGGDLHHGAEHIAGDAAEAADGEPGHRQRGSQSRPDGNAENQPERGTPG